MPKMTWPKLSPLPATSPIATGERPAALRSQFETDCFPRGALSRAASSAVATSGRRLMCSTALPAASICSRKQRMTAHRLAPPSMPPRVIMASPRTVVRAERQRDVLERLAFEAIAEDVGPRHGEPGIGRLQRRDGDAPAREPFDPRAIGAEPRPTRAAERHDGRIRHRRTRAIGRLKQQAVIAIPAGPAMPQRQRHAERIEPPQPRAQQAGTP